MDILFILLLVGAVLFVLYMLFAPKKDVAGRITDNAAELADIVSDVKKFKPTVKGKYSEADMSKQLVKYLQKKYVTVKPEFPIVVGNRAKKVDIDIANGVAGLELKLASKLRGAGEFDRVCTQIGAYAKARYYNHNLALVVFGTKDEARNPLIHQDVRKCCKEANVEYVYIEVD